MNPNTSKNIKANFLLRGLDPFLVLKNYQEGHFRKSDLTPVNIKLESVLSREIEKGVTCYDQIYTFEGTSNNHCIVTIGHKEFKPKLDLDRGHFSSISSQSTPPKQKLCLWCRRTYSHLSTGVPINMDYNSKTGKHIYHCIGNYCGFRCAYAMIIDRNNKPTHNQDPKFSTSEQLLLSFFSELYPNKELKSAPDWILLDINGGPIPEKLFDSEHYTFYGSPNVIIYPSKISYERIIFS